MDSVWGLIFLCGMTFTAGFVDAVAGGGGLISVPAYFLTGLPPHFALGGNKLSACAGTFCAVLRFWKHRKIRWKEAVSGMFGAFVGSSAGTSIALLLPGDILKVVMLIALPAVGVMVFFGDSFKRDLPSGMAKVPGMKTIAISFLIGLCIGAYDGLIGPGTGTFLIIAATLFLHFDLVTSSGNAKVINFASNFASVVVFAAHGAIPYKMAVPAALASIAGGYFGVGFCVRHGSGGVKKMLFVVLSLLFLRFGWDVLSPLFR